MSIIFNLMVTFPPSRPWYPKDLLLHQENPALSLRCFLCHWGSHEGSWCQGLSLMSSEPTVECYDEHSPHWPHSLWRCLLCCQRWTRNYQVSDSGPLGPVNSHNHLPPNFRNYRDHNFDILWSYIFLLSFNRGWAVLDRLINNKNYYVVRNTGLNS